MAARPPFVLLALAFAVAACGSTKPAAAPMETGNPPLAAGTLPPGTLKRTARDVAFEKMIDDLAKADVVYVGETHTDAGHHALQRRVLEHLWTRGRLHAVGMEMFQRPFQPALDDYVFGRIDEEEMLRRTDYAKRWGFPFDLYRGILEFAREKRLPVIALNVEDEIRKEVRASGLDGLSDEQRRSLPALDTSNAEHRAYLEGVYRAHLPKDAPMDAEKFERFYLVMCLWDGVMADGVVRWFRSAPPDGQILVLAGSGHIANRYGIPGRAFARNGKPYRTLVPVTDGDREVFAEAYADFVWVMPAPPAPAPADAP
jgi:uncharacterized iron-regulated protein